MYRRFIIGIIIASIMFVTPYASVQPTTAGFVISSWEYDDGYGQGIELVWPYENSTGSWVALHDPSFVFWNEGSTFEVNATANTALKIITTANINHTLFSFGPDKSENASARSIMNIGIEVSIAFDTVFSRDNMTWTGTCFNDTDTTWAISYYVVIDVILVAGQIYTVELTYEIDEAEDINKTMVFDGADPYSTYTFSAGAGSQGIVGGEYVIDTDLSSDTEYFGYDEFLSDTHIYANVLFTPTAMTGTYRFQPIIYMYQKTDLGSNTRWALGIMWHSGGLRIDHNTANGNAPTLTAVDATAPIINHEYDMTIASWGTETWLRVYDNTAAGLVYSGNTTTSTYDATALYASFGQYSGGNGAMQGTWDDFAIVEYTGVSDWQVSNTVKAIFPVGWHPVAQFGYDAFFIFLGLIMIPVSMMYFVRGGKEDMSRDKLFYFLIAFVIGWSLFLGGIMP